MPEGSEPIHYVRFHGNVPEFHRNYRLTLPLLYRSTDTIYIMVKNLQYSWSTQEPRDATDGSPEHLDLVHVEAQQT
jgi:hypothetical protein